MVVGSFGAPPASGNTPASRELQIVNLSDQKEWTLPFRESDSRDGGKSAPFIAELPAGRYKITRWSLDSIDDVFGGRSTLVTFDVEPTQVTCIGALYPIRDRRNAWAATLPGHNGSVSVRILPRDECPALQAILSAAAPNLRASMRTRLAVNTGCPTCRADIGD